MNRLWNWRARIVIRWWLLALVALTVLPMGVAAARPSSLDHESPATGNAQVVTQGIVNLPSGDVVWRVVERTAEPRGSAKPGRSALGFVLAIDEPVLLTDVTADGAKDVARLAPGEAYLVEAGTRQVRASLSDEPVTYLSIELVKAKDADAAGAGEVLFTSKPFAAPRGYRDLDLVRNVLAVGDQATLPDTGAPVAILATEGTIHVAPLKGRGRTLDAGESAVFDSGELEIEAVSGTAQERGRDSAAYVAAVIGPEIPPMPSTTRTPVPAATAAPTQAPMTGSITVTVYDCQEGITIENVTSDSCPLSEGEYDFALSGPGGELSLADAAYLDGAWQWSGLPLGEYSLRETRLPDGYDFYFIPGSAAVGGSAEMGYTVGIGPGAADIGLSVYNFRPQVVTGSITVDVNLCPDGAMADDFDPAECNLAKGGYALSLVSSDGTYHGMEEATDWGGSLEWSNLPLGQYALFVDGLPSGWTNWVGPDGGIYSESEYAWLAIGGSSPTAIWVAIYAFSA